MSCLCGAVRPRRRSRRSAPDGGPTVVVRLVLGAARVVLVGTPSLFPVSVALLLRLSLPLSGAFPLTLLPFVVAAAAPGAS